MEHAITAWVQFLTHDVSITFLPAAYFRVKLAPSAEHRLVTYGTFTTLVFSLWFWVLVFVGEVCNLEMQFLKSWLGENAHRGQRGMRVV